MGRVSKMAKSAQKIKPGGNGRLEKSELIRLYHEMVLVRRLEER